MKKVSLIRGIAAPLPQANIDTDAIMPKQFLKSIKRTGYGEFLFDAWRYLDKGELGMTQTSRTINPDFVLNQPPFQHAKILVTLQNFGCGSSREHAVWGLMEFGFEAVIAPSFADIFYSNAIKNGLLAVVLPEQTVNQLFKEIAHYPDTPWEIDLPKQQLKTTASSFTFEISASDKETLLLGLDDIALTLQHADTIKNYEAKRKQIEPWIFDGLKGTRQ